MHESMKRLHQVSGLMRKKEIAQAMNVAQSTVTNWGTRGVSQQAAIQAAEMYDTDASYILSGADKKTAKGLSSELLRLCNASIAESDVETDAVADHDKLAVVSLVSNKYVVKSEVEGYQARPLHLTRCMAFRVSAQSMSPVFVTDDIAYIDLDISEVDIKDGCYVLAIANNEKYASIKKVTHGASSDDVYLSHINTEIPGSEMRKIDDFGVIGIVDSKLTSFR